MPGWLNTKLNDAPGLSLPELNAPLSAVTVWAILSWFVQVTFVPGAIISEPGVKAKLAIDTCCDPVIGIDVTGLVGSGLVGMAAPVVDDGEAITIGC